MLDAHKGRLYIPANKPGTGAAATFDKKKHDPKLFWGREASTGSPPENHVMGVVRRSDWEGGTRPQAGHECWGKTRASAHGERGGQPNSISGGRYSGDGGVRSDKCAREGAKEELYKLSRHPHIATNGFVSAEGGMKTAAKDIKPEEEESTHARTKNTAYQENKANC